LLWAARTSKAVSCCYDVNSKKWDIKVLADVAIANIPRCVDNSWILALAASGHDCRQQTSRQGMHNQ